MCQENLQVYHLCRLIDFSSENIPFVTRAPFIFETVFSTLNEAENFKNYIIHDLRSQYLSEYNFDTTYFPEILKISYNSL